MSRGAALARVGGLAALLASLVAVLALSGSLSAERVRDWVDGFGAAGPVVFICLSALLTVALFPGPLLAGASGLLFGTALGTPISIAAATLGASLAFSLSRWWAHDAVLALAGPRLLALRDLLARRGFLSVLYARIAPGVPYNLVNYAAGLTAIPLRTFAAATALGASPRAFAYTALGGSLDDLGSPEAIVAICLLVAMAIGGLAWVRLSGSAGGWSSRAGRSAGRP
jgi:uncharacterized membrane protein YdjX (TVP38/TMEM64 family)